MNSKQRVRGRILTPDGLTRLQQAIRAWEVEHEMRCTQERIRELTSEVKERGLDQGTIRKILKAEEGVDPESIRCLFITFGLQLSETDLIPFSHLQIQADPNFVGRERAIADLNTLINRGAKVIVIQARGGVGKTTLARKYLQQEFSSFLEFPIAKEMKDIASIESLVEEKLRQLREEPGREFFVSLDRLKCKLQNERIGILIDNLEPALDAAGKFIKPHRSYVELLRVLTDPTVQSVTFITSRERLNEYSISVQHYPLRDLSLEAWKQYFQNRFQLFSSGEQDFDQEDESVLAALHNACGGNAKAMDIFCSAILTDYAGDMKAYWQANQDDLLIERPLEDLVVGQFDRLQQTDPDTYNLLCRMGCYRYQDVLTVPSEGLLCLLWDVPENRQRRVVNSLRDRSMVEFEDGKYWLQPVIRYEAIERLKKSEDWENANRAAAAMWMAKFEEVKTIPEALETFEAYYHFLGIEDHYGACSVILSRKNDQEENDLFLGSLFAKLGLAQYMTVAINHILNKLNRDYYLGRLYNLLGDQYLVSGDIHKAIECNQESGAIAAECLKSTALETDRVKFDELRKTAISNMGLCKMALGETTEAIEHFEEAASFNRNAVYYLAFLYSCIGDLEQASKYVLASENLLLEYQKDSSSLPHISWYMALLCLNMGLTYRELGEFEKAKAACLQALAHSNDSHRQLRAKIINALAEIYREQGNLEKALESHHQAIEISNEIGAKCELAESHHQLGITYQMQQDVEKSDENFRAAIQLFSQMKAPKQVERVKRSMEANINN